MHHIPAGTTLLCEQPIISRGACKVMGDFGHWNAYCEGAGECASCVRKVFVTHTHTYLGPRRCDRGPWPPTCDGDRPPPPPGPLRPNGDALGDPSGEWPAACAAAIETAAAMLEAAHGPVPMAPPTHVPGEEVAAVDGTFMSVACATLGTASHGTRHALWMTPAALAAAHTRRGAHTIWEVFWGHYRRAWAEGAVLTALDSASDAAHLGSVQYRAATFVPRAVCRAAKAAHQKQQAADLGDALRGPGRAQREAHQRRARVLVRGSGGALHAGQDTADGLADELDRQDSALPHHDPRCVQAAEAEAAAGGVVGRPPDPLPPPTLPAAAPRPVTRTQTAAASRAPTTPVHPAQAAEPATTEPGVLEVADRIADLNNTAPGASGVVALALKRGGVAATRLMARPIQAAWRSGVVPPQWRRALGNP
eukprot:358373-Chlamydomonas_euryale.AAC.3